MAQKKSVLEQALLQVETLEEAVKANAKGILRSTMKEELNDLLKEKEDENPEDKEKDVPAVAGDNEPSISDEEPTAGDSDEIPAVDDNSKEESPEPEISSDEEPDDVLDMTGASEEEVLKVFKAMKPEDGIVVKKDGNTVQFSDEGNEYIIKLDDEGSPEGGEEKVPDLSGEETPEFGNEENPEDELSEQSEPTGKDEVVYEIELDDEENADECEVKEGEKDKPFTKAAPKKTEAKESVTVHKSVTAKDGQPYTKTAPKGGVKKLQANEETLGNAERPGTPPEGLGKPEVKEPGRGKETTTAPDKKRDGNPPKDLGTPEKKEPGKGGNSAKQVEDHPGTPIKGEGKPSVQEPGVGKKVEASEEECKECGDKSVKEVEATEAARTKWNIHGDKGGGDPGRAGIKAKKLFKAGSGKEAVNEEVETLKRQNAEYKKALILFKDKLNEVAVFNANLAFATRLFTEHSTTKQEKLDILKRFDSISTITESKNLYNAIKGELETKKPISEAAIEKISSTPASSSGELLSETKAYESPQFKRMKELMQKIK